MVGRLLMKRDPRWLVVVGLSILSFGMFQLSKLNLYTSFWTFVFVWTISRGGMPFMFVPINVMAFSFVPKERMNSATGLINLARNIGGSVGISLVITLQAHLTQRHQANLVSHMTPLDPRYRDALRGLTAMLHQHGSTWALGMHQAQGLLYGELQRQSAMLAFIDVYWLLGFVCLAMIPLMFIMRRPHRDTAPHLYD
jgi:DHA2 family multidrug resistance protein